MPEPKTRVIGYVRVSTSQQKEEGWSLETQTEKLRAYSVALDLELVDLVVDSLSAKSLNRKGLQEALQRLEAGEAEGLLIVKLDRLTRSVRDLGTLLEQYFEKRFQLLSVNDAIDTRSAAGRLVLNVLTSVTQWEREAISERTREVLGHLKRDGVKLGRAGLGWRHEEEKDKNKRRIIAPVKVETTTVLRILELREQGHSLRAVASALTAEGHTTKRGGQWAPETVRKVLKRARVQPQTP